MADKRLSQHSFSFWAGQAVKVDYDTESGRLVFSRDPQGRSFFGVAFKTDAPLHLIYVADEVWATGNFLVMGQSPIRR